MFPQENDIEKIIDGKLNDFEKKIDMKIQERIRERVGLGFTDRKVADTPSDGYMVVNRRFVTMNGSIASRPTSSVAVVGQPYLATDIAIPTWYTLEGWRNGVGSIVASA